MRYFLLFFPYNFRSEIDNDVIPDVAVENVGVDICVKLGDSRSNGFQNIRGADFVSNEQDETYPKSVKRLKGVSLKNCRNAASDGFGSNFWRTD